MTWQEQFNSGEVVYRDEQGLVLCGDCLKIVPQLPKATMIFADPPDNLGLKYDNYKDKIHNKDYVQNIAKWLAIVTDWGKIAWFSIYHKWLTDTLGQLSHWEKIGLMGNVSWRVFIWRFTFGQHNRHDCGNGFRPIIRIMHNDAVLYPGAIQEPSKRQTDYNDKRANPAGRVPDDVWEFSRVCGTFKERRTWHPNQHPEALIERIVKFSTKEGDLVTDMSAGTGTVHRVCRKLNRRCISIDISKFYCEKIAEELREEQFSGEARSEGSV